jgi:rhamnosyltransferase
MKIVAVVTSYNPDPQILQRNIESYLPWIDHLIVWENTPKEKSNLGNIGSLSHKIEICSTGKNEYLALPYNQCIEWANIHNCDYILTMDQDSCFEKDAFKRYIDRVEACKDNKVAIFAPTTEDISGDDQDTLYIQGGSTVYSSGSIYKRRMFEAIGQFREDFMIYCLDTEICMRAIKSGFSIVMFTDVYMEHTAGYKTKGIFGITINNYSAQATYFIIRNHLWLWKLYPEDSTFATKYRFFKYIIGFRIAKLFFEEKRILKLKAILKALLHGTLRRPELTPSINNTIKKQR